MDDVLSSTVGGYPWQQHDHFSRSTADSNDDSGDFLSTARPNFNAISVTSGRIATAYREPYGDPGLLSTGAYHELYQQRCRLMASPYHEPYAESAMPYSYPAAEPCSAPYYPQHHSTGSYPADAVSTGFADSSSYAARFYPLLPVEEVMAFTSPLHDYAPTSHGIEAKRFKSADVVSAEHVAHPGVLGRLGAEDVFSASQCAATDGAVRYGQRGGSGGVASSARQLPPQYTSGGGGDALAAAELSDSSPASTALDGIVSGAQSSAVYSSFGACPSLQSVTTKMVAQ